MKLAKIWEETEVFVKIVKSLYFSLLLWLQSKLVGMHFIYDPLQPSYEVSLNFFYISEHIMQSDNSSVLTLAIVMSYHLHLHIKMASSTLQVSQL